MAPSGKSAVTSAPASYGKLLGGAASDDAAASCGKLAACDDAPASCASAEAAALVAEIDRIVAAAGELGLDPTVTARAHQLRAVHADQDGDLEAALAHHEASLASFERVGDLRNACLTLSNLGFVRASLGALAEAEEALLRAGAGAERMGLATVAALAEAMRAQGRAGEALIAAKEAAGLLASIKSIEDFEVLIGLAHAGALEACGEPEAAKEAIAGAWRRLSARADRLKGATRTRFLGAVTDNARCRELAQRWGVTGEDEG